jgi:hypothetical protein
MLRRGVSEVAARVVADGEEGGDFHTMPMKSGGRPIEIGPFRKAVALLETEKRASSYVPRLRAR